MQAGLGRILLLLMGAGFLLSQVLILRKCLVLFQGNELTIGIVLGNWFLLEALGSRMFGRRADRSADPLASFVLLLGLLSILLPATLLLMPWLVRAAGGAVWESVSLARVFLCSVLVLAPLALGNGAAFVFGCRMRAMQGGREDDAPGQTYVLESVGAFVAGLTFTFVLVGRTRPLDLAWWLGALDLLCACLLLFAPPPGRPSAPAGGAGGRTVGPRTALRAVCLLLLAVFVVGGFGSVPGHLRQWALRVQWHPLEVEKSVDSPFGNITVARLGDQRVLYQNGLPSVSLPDPDIAFLETFVHVPLLATAAPARVLLIGGGVGGGIAEVLKHPVDRVVVAEPDPALLRTARGLGSSLVRSELEDPRTRIREQDGRSLLLARDARYDTILLHVPDPVTLQFNRFYTQEFFRAVRRRLRPGGVAAFSLPGSDAYMGAELAGLNRCVLQTVRSVFPFVRVLPGKRSLFLVSADVPLHGLDAAGLAQRLRRRAVRARVVRPAYLEHLLDSRRETWFREQTAAAPPVGLNRDLSPSLLPAALAYHGEEVQAGFGGARGLAGRLRRHVLGPLLIVAGVPVLVRMLGAGRRRLRPALSFAIFSTGAAGMGVEIVVLLSFQAGFGYLYQWFGVLIASFMGGLGLGSLLMTRAGVSLREALRGLLALELLLLALLGLAALGLLGFQGEGPGAGLSGAVFKVLLVATNVLAGLLVGGEFPLAVRAARQAEETGVGAAAGRFYALDLAGAWLGTFAASVLLVPQIGAVRTLGTVAALKAWSVALLLVALLRRHGGVPAGPGVP